MRWPCHFYHHHRATEACSFCAVFRPHATQAAAVGGGAAAGGTAGAGAADGAAACRASPSTSQTLLHLATNRRGRNYARASTFLCSSFNRAGVWSESRRVRERAKRLAHPAYLTSARAAMGCGLERRRRCKNRSQSHGSVLRSSWARCASTVGGWQHLKTRGRRRLRLRRLRVRSRKGQGFTWKRAQPSRGWPATFQPRGNQICSDGEMTRLQSRRARNKLRKK